MALHLQRRTASYPSTETWENLTLDDTYHSFRYQASYSSPTRLSFVVEADSHTIPLDYTDYVRFWDDAGYLPDGVTAQSSSHPIFEGWIEEVTPGTDPTGVNVVAYDPTYRASRMALVMSAAADAAVDPNDFPVDGQASFPRAVWNCPDVLDPDYAFSIGQDLALGQIVQSILDNAILPLKHIGAAKGSDTSCYITSDTGSLSLGVWSGNLTFKPEEKIVATSETPRSLIERLLRQHEPTFKLFWEPGTRRWRLHKLTDATAVTIRVNDPAESVPVIACEIRRSAEGRYSAVKIYGPQGVEWKTAVWNGPSGTGHTLVPTASSTYDIGNVGEQTTCYWSFTIDDTTFNRIGMKGPEPIMVPDAYFGRVLSSGEITSQLITTEIATEYPALVVEYGSTGSRTHRIAFLDRRNGIVEIDAGTCLYLWDNEASGNRYVLPTKVTLHYPNLTDPITVRSPDDGSFTGTVYSVGGIESEYKEYNESLAVDYRYGAPVTTTTRTERMQKYADRLLQERKDLVHAGAIRFHGADYRFAWLEKRIHVAAMKEDGTDLTTGWESIGAWVTDVDIDYSEMVTTVSMHTDQMELFGIDPEDLKLKLGIRPATWQVFFNWSTFFYYGGVFGSDWTQTYGVNVNVTAGYFDEKGGIQ